jgi:hypothetical protein
LPRLPDTIDLDAWLKRYHEQVFKRRVRSNGYVSVDKSTYYVGQKHKGQRVLLQLNAETKQFDVTLDEKIIKTMDIKGLYHGEMDFDYYLEYITKEAVSEERHLKYKRRRYTA